MSAGRPEFDTTPETLGARLREARHQRGWNQGDLAFHARVSQGRVSEWELGRRTVISLPTIIRLADALGVTIDWLVGRTTYTK